MESDIIQGRLTTDWITYQERYSGITLNQTTAIITELILLVMKTVLKTWFIRNQAQHETTPSFLANKVKYGLTPSVTAICNSKNQISTIDQEYFDIDQDTVIQLTACQLEAWDDQATIFINSDLSRETLMDKLQIKPLSQYVSSQQAMQLNRL
jgi:hypothetical protein